MSELSSSLIDSILSDRTARIFVAYSGGIDSHVLLHLCASESAYQGRITAVYVHHGLQREADAWAEHCRHIAGLLGVDFCGLRVDARPQKRQSPEEAARIARYMALQNLLQPDDVVLVGQHREDQVETVLLQLFRGAGVAGLAAMPERMPFGAGVLLRPLLNASKNSILRYAEKHGLDWVEDPSNQTIDYDRNFLRNSVMPLLKQRWPAIDKTVSRAARHCAEASELLTELADNLLADCCNQRDRSMAIDTLARLDIGRRNLLLRRWFEWHGLKAPGETRLQSIVREVVGARIDADPELRYQDWLIRRYRGRLYCIPGNILLPDSVQPWPKGVKVLQRSNDFRVRLVPADAGIPVRVWANADVTVRPRQGGEVVKLPGREGRHTLKKLYQEASVPPWHREVLPLIYLDGRLAAVAGFWIAAEFFCAGGEACYEILWEPNE